MTRDVKDLTAEQKQEIAEKLRQHFAAIDANQSHVSAEQTEEIFTEAMRSSRPGYRPHR
jgi:hypothetical protein